MSSQAWTIRKATGWDHTGLCELFREVDALHAEALPHIFETAEQPARSQAFLAEILATEEATLLVAEQGETVTGFVHVRIQPPSERPAARPRRFGVIEIVAVAEKFRRQGLGQALVRQAER